MTENPWSLQRRSIDDPAPRVDMLAAHLTDLPDDRHTAGGRQALADHDAQQRARDAAQAERAALRAAKAPGSAPFGFCDGAAPKPQRTRVANTHRAQPKPLRGIAAMLYLESVGSAQENG